MAPAEVEVEQPVEHDEVERDQPWIVIVWNDPINLMSYVTLVLQKLFGYSRTKARRLMLQVQHNGSGETQEEFSRLVGDELLDGRRRALATIRETVGRDRLTPEEAESWLTGLNALRLVLGTQLGVR